MKPVPTKPTSTRPRRRTQAERRAQTRARLLRAARKVFGARGYHGTTLDEVATKAGLSKGALYHHFDGKESLFLALLDERLDERIKALEGVFAPGTSAASGGSGLRDASADALRVAKEGGEWRLLFFEFVAHASRDRRLHAELARRRARMRGALTAVIEERAQALDRDLPLPAEQLAVAINALANGLAIEALLAPDEVPDELMGEFLAFAFQGMAAGFR